MLQPTSTKAKSNRREPKQSKKPRVTELVVDERVSIPVEPEPLVTDVIEPLVTDVIEPLVTEPKTQCPCGSLITTKSLTKHYSTKKHTSWLFAQEATSLVL
jgi:hypothetical protein